MVENILFKKGLREIKENLKQYITVILIAILAVSLFSGIYANYKDFKYKLDDVYTKSNMCDGIVLVSENDPNIANYLNDNNIYYEERLFLTAKVDSYNINIATFNENSTLNKAIYTSEDYDSNSVLVSDNFLTKTETKIGDIINLELDGLNILGFNLNDVKLELKINATMTHPEALNNSEYEADFIYLGEEALITSIYNYLNDTIYASYITKDFIKNTIPNLYNEYLLKTSDISIILDYINNNFNVLYALDRANLPTNLTIEADVIQAKQLIYIFPIIFYLVALLIILTSISELIDKEQKNIGLLKALGYSNLEILLHYTNIFIILCIIGGILGIIIGPIIIPKVMDQKYNILYQLPNINTPFFRPFYLVSVIILIFIVYLTAIFALSSILKKVPASSLRGDNSYQMKPTLFDYLKLKKDKFLTLRMALRNMKRKISRTFMVIFGVMGCSALLLCGFGIEDTLDNSINTEIELIPFDISLNYLNEVAESKILENDNVLEIDSYSKCDINIIKDKMISSYLYILPEQSHIFVPKYDKDSCLISSKVAKSINAKEGDIISFIYNGKSYEVVITNIIDISFSQGIFISRARNLLDLDYTNAWIRTIDNTKNEQTLKELEENSDIYFGQTINELKEVAEEKLSSVRIMTNTIKIFAILLAIVVLYNLALLNFKERIKDIATLKVLGFNNKEIAGSFLLEILILTIISSILGLFLGYPLMYGVLVINENPLLSYIYHINIDSYLITLLLTGGFGVLINLLMSTFINKVKMVESLKAVD